MPSVEHLRPTSLRYHPHVPDVGLQTANEDNNTMALTLRQRARLGCRTCPQVIAIAPALFLLQGLPQSVQEVRLRELRIVDALPGDLPEVAGRHDRREGAREQEHVSRAQPTACLQPLARRAVDSHAPPRRAAAATVARLTGPRRGQRPAWLPDLPGGGVGAVARLFQAAIFAEPGLFISSSNLRR